MRNQQHRVCKGMHSWTKEVGVDLRLREHHLQSYNLQQNYPWPSKWQAQWTTAPRNQAHTKRLCRNVPDGREHSNTICADQQSSNTYMYIKDPLLLSTPNTILTLTSAKTQHFYALPKPHRTQLKVWPIVSACLLAVENSRDSNGCCSNSSNHDWKTYAYIEHTTDLLQRLNNIDKEQLKGKIEICVKFHFT